MSSGSGVQKSRVGSCSTHGAQTGRCFTTGPLGKSWQLTLKCDVEYILVFQMHQNSVSLYLYMLMYYRQANLPFCLYSVQFSSVAQSCLTLCDPMDRSMPGLLSITISRNSPKPMSIESVMPSSHLVLCRSLLLLPPIPPCIRVFSNESALCAYTFPFL